MKPSNREIAFKALEAARERGNLNLRMVGIVTLAEYREETEEAAEAAQAILKPILEQVERVRQARKGRRTPGDIDPETGEEIPEESADTRGGAPAEAPAQATADQAVPAES